MLIFRKVRFFLCATFVFLLRPLPWGFFCSYAPSRSVRAIAGGEPWQSMNHDDSDGGAEGGDGGAGCLPEDSMALSRSGQRGPGLVLMRQATTAPSMASPVLALRQ